MVPRDGAIGIAPNTFRSAVRQSRIAIYIGKANGERPCRSPKDGLEVNILLVDSPATEGRTCGLQPLVSGSIN